MLLLLLQTDVPPPNLSTIAGVVGTAFVLTEVAKRFITPTTPFVSKIPVLGFPIVIALVLAFLSNKVFKGDDGKPFLVGNIWTILFTAGLGASSTSGLFTWLRSPATTVGESIPLGSKPAPDAKTKLEEPKPETK